MNIDQSAPEKNFIATAGDDILFDTVFKEQGVLYPVSGWTFKTEVREEKSGLLLATLVLGTGIEHISIGRVRFKIPGTITQGYGCKKIVFDIQAVNETGIKRTYMKGILTIKKDVTV